MMLGALLPLTALAIVATRTSIDRDEVSSLSYSRNATQATRPSAVDSQRPKPPSQVAVSPALRSLLVAYVVRVGLLELACFSLFAAFGLANDSAGWSRTRQTNIVFFLIAGAMVIPTIFPRTWFPWGPPPVWLAGLLALTGGYNLRRQLARPPLIRR
jgi:hypothetical protein